jgi:hypothetical protein
MNDLMSVAYDNIKKKDWEETKVTSELLDTKVDLMLLLRKERCLLLHLAYRIKGNEEFKKTDSDTAGL